jgi:hypothetical protein
LINAASGKKKVVSGLGRVLMKEANINYAEQMQDAGVNMLCLVLQD